MLTYHQFLRHLQLTPRTWRLSHAISTGEWPNFGSILNAVGQCPLAAVADTGYREVAPILSVLFGMNTIAPGWAWDVMSAADRTHDWGCPNFVRVRGDLLGACGMLGDGWVY